MRRYLLVTKITKKSSANGQWFDCNGVAILFDPEAWGVNLWQNKLYGGPQFERLLDEFKAVCEHTELPDISVDDVVTASGIPKMQNVPNFLWAVSPWRLREMTCARQVSSPNKSLKRLLCH